MRSSRGWDIENARKKPLQACRNATAEANCRHIDVCKHVVWTTLVLGARSFRMRTCLPRKNYLPAQAQKKRKSKALRNLAAHSSCSCSRAHAFHDSFQIAITVLDGKLRITSISSSTCEQMQRENDIRPNEKRRGRRNTRNGIIYEIMANKRERIQKPQIVKRKCTHSYT